MTNMLDELLSRLQALPEDEREEVKTLALDATRDMRWIPNPGPQTDAYFTEADETFYGGAAGGGKTDLILGLALTQHTRSLVLRREGTNLRGIEQRMVEIIGTDEGYNKTRREWKLGGDRVLELGSVQHESDKISYQGRAHDLKAFDEITHFLESQYNYIIGWNRSTKAGQRCRVICAGNPPSTSEGQWVKRAWGPWLDLSFPKGYKCLDADGNPAEFTIAIPGELRWYTTDNSTGETIWVDRDWRSVDSDGNEIRPKSRTFIGARLSDNPYLGNDYRARIAAMEEPVRSQLLYGDFNVATSDQVNQVIPTAWLRAAMDRWRPDGDKEAMISVGVDIAQGGNDRTVIVARHKGGWCGEPVVVRGDQTPDGPTASALVIQHVRDNALIVIDMGGGFGQSTHDHLRFNGGNVDAFNGATRATRQPSTPTFERYLNLRAQAFWELRMRLDPSNPERIAIPPKESIVADLCAPIWWITPQGLQIESKDSLRKRLGRSPDEGDAIVMAFFKPRTDYDAELYNAGRRLERVAKVSSAMGSWDPIW